MEDWRMQLTRKSKTNHESLMSCLKEFSVIFLLTYLESEHKDNKKMKLSCECP